MKSNPVRPEDLGVSVVIPVYNASAFIASTLESVFKQTLPPREVILVNDGSKDTPELEIAIAPFRDRLTYLQQQNAGVSAARNTGIRAATQPLLAFIDSDDLWEPNYLEVQVGILAANPDIDLVYGDSQPIRMADGQRLPKTFMQYNPSEGEVTFAKLVRLQCNVNTSVTARRAIILKAGMYDEKVRTCEDADLWMRVVKAGGKISYHHQVIMTSRLRPGSLSSHQTWMYEDSLTVLEKLRRTLDLTDEEKEAIRQQTVDYTARKQVHQAKEAFFSNDPKAAADYLAKANEFFHSPKLRVAAWMLRTAPGLLLKLYHLRDRFVFKHDTKSKFVAHTASE